MAVPEPFDYRKLLAFHGGQPDWYDDRLQAEFDTVDRMAALIGDIPFEELFARPLAVVIPRLQANLCRARAGLIKHPGEVQDILDDLVKTAGDRTFSDLVHSKRGQYPEAVEKALITLTLRHGIHFPMPNHFQPKNYQRAMRDLIEFAGRRTYMDVFRDCKCKLPRNEYSALYYAIIEGHLFKLSSGFCCDSTDHCISCTSGGCLPGLNGFCAAGATSCNPPHRPSIDPALPEGA